MSKEVLERIKKEKIIAIVRNIPTENCIKLAKALYDGGIRIMEITFNQSNPDLWKETTSSIERVREEFGEKMTIGAGTVVSEEQLKLAHDAGAQLIISPDSNEKIIRGTKELDMVSIPGAMTPTEVLSAYNWGADFVKIFPAGALGTSYLKAIFAPINHVPILAVGGVNEDNLESYLAVGAAGAGIGGNLVKSEFIKNGQFDKITQTASLITSIAKKY